MTSTSRLTPIKVEYSNEHYQCGDGCCDEYSDHAYVTMPDGEKFEVDVTNGLSDMYDMVLAKLGYEVEEESN